MLDEPNATLPDLRQPAPMLIRSISRISCWHTIGFIKTADAGGGDSTCNISKPHLKENCMKRTLTVLTAAIFAGAMAVPAFAQNTGAGVGVNVGGTGMHAGVNGDLNNSDAEHAQPNPGSSSSETSVRASNESATNTTADQGADAIKPRFRRHAKKSSSDSSIVEPSNAGISAGADANSGMNVGNK